MGWIKGQEAVTTLEKQVEDMKTIIDNLPKITYGTDDPNTASIEGKDGDVYILIEDS